LDEQLNGGATLRLESFAISLLFMQL